MPAPSSDVDDDVDDDAPTVRTRVRGKRVSRSWARRKHLGWITVGSVVLILAVGVGVVVATWDSGRRPVSEGLGTPAAVSSGATTAPATTPTAPATTPTAAVSSPTTTRPAATAVRGIINAVGDSRYTMTSNTGLTYTVVVTATTKFTRNRNFSSFGAGDAIAVRGALAAGVITATSVGPANVR